MSKLDNAAAKFFRPFGVRPQPSAAVSSGMSLDWPAVALILGILALFVFRAPLSRLLDRTEKVKDWLTAPKQPAVPAAPDRLPTRSESQEQKALEELTSGFNNRLLLMQEESIRVDLETHGLKAESACEKVLMKHLAGTQIALHFERVYAILYNSQLQALRWLNAQTAGVSSRALNPFYERAAVSWPAIYEAFTFRSWLGFLAAHGLIKESEESIAAGDQADPFGLEITVLGREFLAFLVNGGRADPPFG